MERAQNQRKKIQLGITCDPYIKKSGRNIERVNKLINERTVLGRLGSNKRNSNCKPFLAETSFNEMLNVDDKKLNQTFFSNQVRIEIPQTQAEDI